jgi:NitT/TauT family transport system permease protein
LKIDKIFWQVVSIATFFLAWHLLAFVLANPALPTPGNAFSVFLREIQTGLWKHFLISGWRVLASIAISLIAAVPLGLMLGREDKYDRFFAPMLYLTYPIPKIVFLPLVMVMFGLGDFSKIFLITLVVFFQILVTTRDAARHVSQGIILSVLSLGATKRDLYRHVIWPAIIPDLFTALRIGSGTAIAVLFFAESIASSEGLGYYLMDAWSRYAYPEMFAGIIAMGILGYSLYLLIDMLDRRICGWKRLQ